MLYMDDAEPHGRSDVSIEHDPSDMCCEGQRLSGVGRGLQGSGRNMFRL